MERTPAYVLGYCRRSKKLPLTCPKRLPRMSQPSPHWETSVCVAGRSGCLGLTWDVLDTVDAGNGDRPPIWAHISIYAGNLTTAFRFTYPTHGVRPRRLDGLFAKARAKALFIGSYRWGGKVGTVVLAPSYPAGGEQGDHLIFRWSRDGVGFAVGLHAWEPLSGAMGTLKMMIGSVAPPRASIPKTPDPAPKFAGFVINGQSIAQRFPHRPSIAFRYPSNWHVATRRLDDVLDPHTIVAVASYKLRPGPRDDCDGTHARGRPSDGVFVLVKEVLDRASLRTSLPRLHTKPRHFRLPTSGRAGCLAPPSVAYQFRVAERAFYIWISVGPKASAKTRAALTSLLDGMWVATYPTP